MNVTVHEVETALEEMVSPHRAMEAKTDELNRLDARFEHRRKRRQPGFRELGTTG